jgi:hypothetical protein
MVGLSRAYRPVGEQDLVEDQEPYDEGNAVHDQVCAVDDQMPFQVMQAIGDCPAVSDLGGQTQDDPDREFGWSSLRET